MTGTPRPLIVAECRDCGARIEVATRGEALRWKSLHGITYGHTVRVITPASRHAYGKRP